MKFFSTKIKEKSMTSTAWKESKKAWVPVVQVAWMTSSPCLPVVAAAVKQEKDKCASSQLPEKLIVV